jgi:hypothetical protein
MLPGQGQQKPHLRLPLLLPCVLGKLLQLLLLLLQQQYWTAAY